MDSKHRNIETTHLAGVSKCPQLSTPHTTKHLADNDTVISFMKRLAEHML